MKAKVIAVTKTGQKLKTGGDIYAVMTEPKSEGGSWYKCFSKRIEEMTGQEIEFTTRSHEWQGTIEYIMELPKEEGAKPWAGKSGFVPRGESEASIIQRHTAMCISYAKDLAETYIQAGQFADPGRPSELTVFIQTMYEAMYNTTMKQIKPFLKGGQPVASPKPVAPTGQAPAKPAPQKSSYEPPLDAYGEDAASLPTAEDIPF